MLKKFLFGFVVCFISIFYARADSGTSLINRSQWSRFNEYSRVPTIGWRLFGGLGLGYGAVSGGEFTRGPRGGQYLLDTHLNYQMRAWSIEFGLARLY